MLEVQEVDKQFRSGDTILKALNKANMSLKTGAFVAIVGKSGSGKTTLLTLLGGLERPTSGAILLDGEDITKLSDHHLTAYRRRKIGFIFQHYNLIPNLSALENVMLPMEFAGVPAKKRRARAVHLLNQVGLEGDKQQRRPGRLSGGEQQRVSIARALANRPGLILADEPTGNLDSQTSKIIVKLLQELARSEETTIIVVTHDLNLTEHTDQTFRLQDGQLTTHTGGTKALLSEDTSA